MTKIRDKGLSEADITLEQLLRYGRTLESTIQQSLVMGNSVHATSTSVNAVSSRSRQTAEMPVREHPVITAITDATMIARGSTVHVTATWSQHQQWWPGSIDEHPTEGTTAPCKRRITATPAFAQDAGNRRITELNALRGAKSVINAVKAITLQMSAGPLPQTLT